MPSQLIVLQHFAYKKIPTSESRTKSLYFHGDFAWAPAASGLDVLIKEGDFLQTSTFYNCFSLTKWFEYCSIKKLFVNITGRGHGRVDVFNRNFAGEELFLTSFMVELSEKGTPYEIPLPEKKEGIIFLRLVALSDVVVTGGAFLTDAPIQQNVRLGVVVTHYNQIESVSRLIHSFQAFRKEFIDDIGNGVELVVVDNSRTIPDALSVESVRIIKSPNFGGAGGYSRGKLYLEESGFTHCIYMDDDVGCDFECVFRVLMIFAFAKMPFSISGTIIDKTRGCRVLQVGGKYKHGDCWWPLLPNLDLADVGSVTLVDRLHRRISFGAFPFYAYPLRSTPNYPFPFFVRGDDVLFGLQNEEANIVAWPGVGVSISSSTIILRENPQSLYQDARALFVIELCTGAKRPLTCFLRVFSRLVLTQLFSYKYASVESIFRALRDVSIGPSFFRANLDTTQIRQKNKELCQAEQYKWLDLDLDLEEPLCSRCRVIRFLTLNGFLLPKLFMKGRKKVALVRKDFHAPFGSIFRYRYVCYENAAGMQLLVEHDKWKMAKILLKWFFSCVHVVFAFHHIRRAYLAELHDLTSSQFWRDNFSQKKF